jgi:hypothetical protein
LIARSLRSALLLAATAAIAFVCAAPASAGQATDFKQALPAAKQLAEPTARQLRIAERRNGYGIEGRVLYRTPPITAPGRFDLVGIAGEMHTFEYRARKRHGEWSDWVEAGNGDPVYTGGSDRVQVRSRGVPIEGELHDVRINETPEVDESDERPAADRRRGPPEPNFVTRSEWGADAKQGGCEPRDKPSIGTPRLRT